MHMACRQVRLAERFKWVATHGVEDDEILNGLPEDLQIKIKYHVCGDRLKEVQILLVLLFVIYEFVKHTRVKCI